MKNTLKPLPTFEAKENTSESSYAKELRCAFLEGYNEARQEFQKDKERLEEDSNFLSCLEACGVDNWEGYDDACEIFEDQTN